jgi:hypothetical protein
MNRPSFALAWSAFSEINVPVAQVGQKIGGKVQANIDSGIFQNACPIRMSYVLNKVGMTIQRNQGYSVVSGAGGKQYMFRVNDMMAFLAQKLGTPDKTVRSPKEADFAGMKGIVVVKGHGWSNAAGHVTLWNGTMCSDTCHLMNDPDNGHFVPERASLWVLP